MASLQNPKFLYFMLLTVQRRWSQSCSYSVLLCGLFYGALHVQSCIVLRSRTFFSHFSIVITLFGEERAVMNLNIHTSYFSHVWTIRTIQRVKNSHEFVTDFERICHTRVTYTFYTSFIGGMNANSSRCSKYPLKSCLSVTYEFFTCIS